mmetsp:Transcript_12166/g.20971  ORF Transcript_12166/g.20971 Transcript_12166/m.20971 type:complete len:233 (-) Transcript_12166:1126-1824(-)
MTKVVWPTDGDVSTGDPASSWMDDLAPVSVSDELKLLLPRQTQAHRGDPNAFLVLTAHHLLALPRSPASHHRIGVVEAGRQAPTRRFLRTRLPGDDPVLTSLPRETPLELHHVGGTGTSAIQYAVDEPASYLALTIRAQGQTARPCKSLARMDDLIGILVDEQAKMLAACLTQSNDCAVFTEDLFLHLLHAGERIPRAGNVDLITGVWSWVSIVKDSIIEELTLQHPGTSVK